MMEDKKQTAVSVSQLLKAIEFVPKFKPGVNVPDSMIYIEVRLPLKLRDLSKIYKQGDVIDDNPPKSLRFKYNRHHGEYFINVETF